MLSIPNRMMRSGIAVMLSVAMMSGLSVSNVSNAQPNSEAERCTVKQLEWMLSQGIDPSGDCPGSFAPYSGSETDTSDEQADAESQALLASCPYTTHGDYPHRSGTDVSAHGWWNTSDYSLCPTYADVEVWIQGLWCNNPPWNCYWVTVAHSESRIRPRNIYGTRTTARRLCVSTATTGFRNVVDVDLVGVDDPADQYVGPPTDVACRPS